MELRSGRRTRSSQHQRGSSCGGGPDRISALPDDLLLLILARLPCITTAARTSVLSRRWSGSGGLWTRLHEIVFRDVPFPSLEAALGRVGSPVVSLLEIRVPYHWSPSPVPDPAGVNSLLCAAARLTPEKFVFALPGNLNSWRSIDVDMSSFHRATSIELDSCLLFLRASDSVYFPALETLSLSGKIPDLDPLLSCCASLRTLRLSSVVHDRGYLRVSSALLQELVVDRSSKRTGRVSIVTPVLKQLTMSFMASDVSISVLAPMLEKVNWDCSYCTYDRPSTVFGLWRLEDVRLQTAERQGQLPSLEICASAVRPFAPAQFTAKLTPRY
ncbi:hypothetical protein VPH35_132727 [Triticum aestivum]